jgi:predicted metal-dependent hydrolase
MSVLPPAPSTGQLPLYDPSRAAPEFGVRASQRARRLTVRVYPGGRVEVTVPAGTRPAAVERFVARHRAWIDARVAELRTHVAPSQQPLPGQVYLQALDEAWQVAYVRRIRTGWRVATPGRVDVYGDPAAASSARRALRGWLLAQAQRTLFPWLLQLAAERGFRFERLQLRRQRTRWGSCSRAGTISLNVCLLFQPRPVVRYLMLHELCHTRHMNHSTRFWRLVAEQEPDWKALDRELLRGWRHVPDWVYA